MLWRWKLWVSGHFWQWRDSIRYLFASFLAYAVIDRSPWKKRGDTGPEDAASSGGDVRCRPGRDRAGLYVAI